MDISKNDIFHVHTFRCGHAEKVTDEEYVKRAVSLGAPGIWFTDHAPFPNDPFSNRMKYCELEEYIYTLSLLKAKYVNQINIHIGLEIEYFPVFDNAGYYQELKNNRGIEILLLGQHMAETTPGHYSFEWNKSQLDEEEYILLGKAQIQGIKSGYFAAVAHPDRIFRRQKSWTSSMTVMAEKIIKAALQVDIPLEINEASKHHPGHFWKEFWALAPNNHPIYGLDAHTLDEVKLHIT